MKQLIKASLVIISVLGAVSGYSQSFLTNGLVAYYPFNGDANDASGNGNNGTVVGATLTTDRFGNANSAYAFDGASDYISFTTIPTTQTADVTFSAWVNPASLDQYAFAVCLGHDDSYSGDGMALGMVGGPTGNYPGNHIAGLFGNVGTLDSGAVYAYANSWYHLVMVVGDGVTSFYVNGVQTPNTSNLTAITPTAFTIGSESGTRFFNGIIDDVRIYNRALSGTEVQELYQYEAPPGPKVGLVKAVKPSFTQMSPGTSYQLQMSTDLVNWTNQGSPFTATSSSMVYTQYFDVPNWNQLYFRLH